jgi:hypothetical protein
METWLELTQPAVTAKRRRLTQDALCHTTANGLPRLADLFHVKTTRSLSPSYRWTARIHVRVCRPLTPSEVVTKAAVTIALSKATSDSSAVRSFVLLLLEFPFGMSEPMAERLYLSS